MLVYGVESYDNCAYGSALGDFNGDNHLDISMGVYLEYSRDNGRPEAGEGYFLFGLFW